MSKSRTGAKLCLLLLIALAPRTTGAAEDGVYGDAFAAYQQGQFAKVIALLQPDAAKSGLPAHQALCRLNLLAASQQKLGFVDAADKVLTQAISLSERC